MSNNICGTGRQEISTSFSTGKADGGTGADISRQKVLQPPALTSRRPFCPAAFIELQEKGERVGARWGLDRD